MINKVQIIGEIIPIAINKEKEENNNIEILNRTNFYFSLLTYAPSSSLTIIRCVVKGDNIQKIKDFVSKKTVLKINGYLRNEDRPSRQIIVKVIDFSALEEFDIHNNVTDSNKVRLLGKIITDFKLVSVNEQKKNKVISFKICVPREKGFHIFFCRVQQEKLIKEFNKILKLGSIVFIEGFLQTKKTSITSEKIDSVISNISRNSSVICSAFTYIDDDSVNYFHPIEEIFRIESKIDPINFSKPLDNKKNDEE